MFTASPSWGYMDAWSTVCKPNRVLMRSKGQGPPHWRRSHWVLYRQSSAFRKMDLKRGVGPDGGNSIRLGQCELIWSLVGIRVTNTASLQIAIRVLNFQVDSARRCAMCCDDNE